jgi:hypothetical protein
MTNSISDDQIRKLGFDPQNDRGFLKFVQGNLVEQLSRGGLFDISKAGLDPRLVNHRALAHEIKIRWTDQHCPSMSAAVRSEVLKSAEQF